jgi:hypothetical protein
MCVLARGNCHDTVLLAGFKVDNPNKHGIVIRKTGLLGNIIKCIICAGTAYVKLGNIIKCIICAGTAYVNSHSITICECARRVYMGMEAASGIMKLLLRGLVRATRKWISQAEIVESVTFLWQMMMSTDDDESKDEY